MANNQTPLSITEKHLKSPRFWLIFNFVATLALGAALLTVLGLGGYKFQYFAFPIALMLTDVLFLLASIFSNFRFRYTLPYPFVYLAITITLTVLTVLTDGGANGTHLFTHAAIYLFLFFHLLSVLAMTFSYLHACAPIGKNLKTRLLASLFGILLVLGCGVYGYYTFEYGWFGQGTLGVERTLEYSWNEQTSRYDVVGLASERGDTVIIPATFNGQPIGTVDCAFAADANIRQIYFKAEDFRGSALLNAEYLLSPNKDRTLHTSVSAQNTLPLHTDLLQMAQSQNNPTLVEIANTILPTGLSDDSVFVTFTYDFEDLAATGGEFLPVWIGKAGDKIPTALLDTINYLRMAYNPADPLNEANMRWAYENANKHIFIGVNSDTFAGFDQPVTQSQSNVKLEFERLYQIHVANDNDTVYELSDAFRFFDATQQLAHVFTRSDIDAWFATQDQRSGFDIAWKLMAEGADEQVALDTTATLSTQITDNVTLCPYWSMQAPTIADLQVTQGAVYGQTVSFSFQATPANADFLLSYEWATGAQAQSTEKNYSISNATPADSGVYTILVTSANPALTSLQATNTATVELVVGKRPLKLDWTMPDDAEYNTLIKTISWEISAEVGADFGIINGDEVALLSYSQNVLRAGTYQFFPELEETAATLYYLRDDATNSFTVTPAPLTVEWGSNELTYNAQPQLPTASATGLGSDGVIEITLTGAIQDAGNATAIATISNTDYVLTNPSYPFTINPYEVTVNWEDLTHTYNATTFRPTATAFTPFIDELLSFDVSGAQTNAGTYTATVARDTTGNYVASNASASTSFTIAQKTISVQWLQSAAVTYTGTAHEYTAQAQNVIAGENVTLSYSYVGTANAQAAPINAGAYSVSALLDPANQANANYTLDGSATLLITVERVKLHLSWAGSDQIYNGATQTMCVTAFGLNDQLLITQASALLQYSNETAVNAGTYEATVALSDATNFTIESGDSYTYTILKRTLNVSFALVTERALTFDGNAWNWNATLSNHVQGEVPTVTLSYSLANASGNIAAPTNVGSYTVTATLANGNSVNENYILTGNTQSFTVAPRAVNVNWTNTALTFNGQLQKPVATYTDVNGTPVALSVSGEQTNASTVAYVAEANGSDANYTLTGNSTTFTISPLAVEVNWSNTTLTYNGSAQKPTASYQDVNGATIALNVSGAQINASTTPYTATASTSDSNYTLTGSTCNFTIDPLAVNVSWSNTTLTYNGLAQKPVATFQDVHNATVTLEVSGAKTNASNSPYTATASTSDSNYTLTGSTCDFTINPLAVNVNWSNTTLIYNGSAQKPTASYQDVSGKTIALNVSGAQTDVSDTPYTATASHADTNYALTGDTTTFTIKPLAVTVSWNNTTLTYNGQAQKPTATYQDVNGETIALTVSGAKTDVGTYTAQASSADNNYTLKGDTCDFTIDPLEVTVNWSNTTLTYNGQAQKPTASFQNVLGNTVTLEVSGAQTDASDTAYTAKATCADDNYTLKNDTSTFRILPLEVTVSWSNTTLTFNGKEQKPHATYEDVNGETIELNVDGAQTNAAISYPARAICADGNYTLTNATTTFKINPLEVTVNWSNTELTYNGQAQKPVASCTDVNGKTFLLNVSGEKTNASDAPYTATASSSDTNYTLNNASATTEFTIAKLQVTLSWSASSFVYSGYQRQPGVAVLNSELVPVSFAAPQITFTQGNGIDVGEHILHVTLDDNFVLLGEDSYTYQITPAQVSIRWNLESGAFKPTVMGAPEDKYVVTYYLDNGTGSVQYDGDFTDAGQYRVEVTLTDTTNYTFVPDTQTEQTFAISAPGHNNNVFA